MTHVRLEDLEHNGIGSEIEYERFYAEFGYEMVLNKETFETLMGFFHFNYLYAALNADCRCKYAELLQPIEAAHIKSLQDIHANWTAKTLRDKDPERGITYMLAAYREIDVLQEKTKIARHNTLLRVLFRSTGA